MAGHISNPWQVTCQTRRSHLKSMAGHIYNLAGGCPSMYIPPRLLRTLRLPPLRLLLVARVRARIFLDILIFYRYIITPYYFLNCCILIRTLSTTHTFASLNSHDYYTITYTDYTYLLSSHRLNMSSFIYGYTFIISFLFRILFNKIDFCFTHFSSSMLISFHDVHLFHLL